MSDDRLITVYEIYVKTPYGECCPIGVVPTKEDAVFACALSFPELCEICASSNFNFRRAAGDVSHWREKTALLFSNAAPDALLPNPAVFVNMMDDVCWLGKGPEWEQKKSTVLAEIQRENKVKHEKQETLALARQKFVHVFTPEEAKLLKECGLP